jgi:hypothetical protein
MSLLLLAIAGCNALRNLDETSEAIQFKPTSPKMRVARVKCIFKSF